MDSQDKQHHAWAAHVSFPNTAESDRQRYVLHDVRVRTPTGDEVVRLMAEAPDHAIALVNSMSAPLYARLKRV